jgi:kynurenine 3-monooxygenase
MAAERDPERTHIMIVGAGLAGALMACYLGRAGYRVTVYERRPDPRVHGFVGGRSINLALSTRGITALDEVGLAGRILEQAIPMRGRMMHPPPPHEDELVFQPYSANSSDAINSVDRGRLNITLIDAADAHENVTMHFDHRCVGVDLDRPLAVFEAPGRFVECAADVIIGADGAFSAVRGQMQKLDRFEYSQHYLEHGYKELTIPPASEIPGYSELGPPGGFDGFAMEPHALHIWPRGGSMMIALPNMDRSFTCTCFWPYRSPPAGERGGGIGFDAIRSEADVEPFFMKHFPDAVPLMPTLARDFMRNPTSSLVTVRCFPWHHQNKVALIGDAAHAIVPFYGQGINAGFEDCRILSGMIERFASSAGGSGAGGLGAGGAGAGGWGAALETFTMHRKVHADAIADMAMDNFIEMRDKVGTRRFRLKKKLEQALHRLVPGAVPLYNLVTFSNMPYAEAKRRAEGQERMLKFAAAGLTLLLAVLALVAVMFVAR